MTGSTSGIGHGDGEVSRWGVPKSAMNGFGDPAEIDRFTRGDRRIGKTRVHFVPADLSKGQAQMLVKQTALCGTALMPDQQQRRDPACVVNPGFFRTTNGTPSPINLSSAFHTSKIALPTCKAGWGRIINVASAHGW